MQLLFLQATAQMVEKLKRFIDSNATLDLAQESDAVLCFLHYQVLELARDCLNKGSEKLITKTYLYEMMDNCDKLLQDVSGVKNDCHIIGAKLYLYYYIIKHGHELSSQ